MAGINMDPIAHLHRRAGFGATPAELEAGRRQGYAATLEQILRYDAAPDAAEAALAQYASQLDLTRPVGIQTWWLIRMLTTTRPLVEKMTLFWHNHFATALYKVKQPGLMLQQNNMFRGRGMGRFRDLLLGVSQDPAMLIWLDSNTNRKGRPNENFARELMELFTMGIGHYTETDVLEAARAFTGWFANPRTGQFFFNAQQHDNGTKTVLGHTANLNGTDVIDILVYRPETARFLARKLWVWFIHDNPTEAEIEPLAQLYLASDTQIRPLVEAILRHPAFTSDAAYLAKVKSPVEFVAGALRSLPGDFNPLVLPGAMRLMNQELFNPPDVKGWDGGMDWISTTTLLARVNFANSITSAKPGVGRNAQTRYGDGIDVAALLGGMSATTAVELVDQLAARLGPVPLNDGTRADLAAYVGAPGSLAALSPESLDTKVRGLIHLIMGTAEYQVG
jgi:uncharacterized protein (DUF1800 family)